MPLNRYPFSRGEPRGRATLPNGPMPIQRSATGLYIIPRIHLEQIVVFGEKDAIIA
jgi:hypothetical protein